MQKQLNATLMRAKQLETCQNMAHENVDLIESILEES